MVAMVWVGPWSGNLWGGREDAHFSIPTYSQTKNDCITDCMFVKASRSVILPLVMLAVVFLGGMQAFAGNAAPTTGTQTSLRAGLRAELTRESHFPSQNF
eukprot:368390-Amphidinium_carterae.1